MSLIGGGPGAWDLITVRGLQRLQAADIIFVDHLGPAHQLENYGVDTQKIVDVGKLPYSAHISQEKINSLMGEAAREGKKVVRLKGGDPYIFGRGFEEVLSLEKEGFYVEVIPGISSTIAVPALNRVPLSMRGVVHNFTVISGHVPPGHPSSLNNWEALAHTQGTLVIIMGVKNAGSIANSLIEYGMDPHIPVAIISEGTRENEQSYRTCLQELGQCVKENNIKPPAVIVIGKVVSL